jgi:hypothetical protein
VLLARYRKALPFSDAAAARFVEPVLVPLP